VLEFKDPAFAKISPKRSFSNIENELFVLVFAKTGSTNSGTDLNEKKQTIRHGASPYVPYCMLTTPFGGVISYIIESLDLQ
jgi:hypothetical protein